MGIEYLLKHSRRFLIVSALAIVVIVALSGEGYCDIAINPNLPRITLPPAITISPNPAHVGETVTITGSLFNTTPYPGDQNPLVAVNFGPGIYVIKPDGTFTAQTSYTGSGKVIIYAMDKWGHMSNQVNLTILDAPNATATPKPSATPTPLPGNQQGTPTPTLIPLATTAPDTISPVTTLSLTGVKDASGMYTSNVVVTLTVADNGGSGANDTRYSLNGFDWTLYTGPFTISTPGNTTVFYRSADRAGNQEIAKVELLTIAGTASPTTGPVASPTASPKADSGLLGGMILPLLIAGLIGLYIAGKSR